MTKLETLKAVVGKVEGATQKQVEEILKAYAEVVKEGIVKGEEVVAIGLGKFASKDVAEREALVNPRQPELGKKTVPAHKAPKFKISKEFKDIFNI
jgi:nucleoid DNA-binding protein